MKRNVLLPQHNSEISYVDVKTNVSEIQTLLERGTTVMTAAIFLWEKKKVNCVSPSLISSFPFGMMVTIPSHTPVPLLRPQSVPALWLLYGDCFLTLSQQLFPGMLKNL